MSETYFQGPLFIVGMQRSGTKLIRDLLNRHERISLPYYESRFIPEVYKKYGKQFELSPETWERVMEEVQETPLIRGRKKEGKLFQKERYRTFDYRELVKRILRDHGPKDPGKKEDLIWGDKTPAYIHNIPELVELFPQAKFIHIIRDPRDFALSVKNRAGKDPLRAAALWESSVRRCKRDLEELLPSDRFIEIFYESLLQEPERVMKGVSSFLDCTYHPDMLSLDRSREVKGMGKGEVRIVRENMAKFSREWPKKKRLRLEEICYDQMSALGYPFHTEAKRQKDLGFWRKNWAYVWDGSINLLYQIKRKKGIVAGLRHWWRLRKTSPWEYRTSDGSASSPFKGQSQTNQNKDQDR